VAGLLFLIVSKAFTLVSPLAKAEIRIARASIHEN
jgi:hypothetical protein